MATEKERWSATVSFFVLPVLAGGALKFCPVWAGLPLALCIAIVWFGLIACIKNGDYEKEKRNAKHP